jgi:hypothetical protein
MAQNGAIGPLVKLLQPGDPMVQASAAGALWNLAGDQPCKPCGQSREYQSLALRPQQVERMAKALH